MREAPVVNGYSPTAGTSTQTEVSHVSQAARDAFWMSTLGGDPYLIPTNGAQRVERKASRDETGRRPR